MTKQHTVTESEALQICDSALEASTADQTEVLLSSGDNALTRFANNHIHQNVASFSADLQVRAVFGKRVAVASGSALSEGSVEDVVGRACNLAKLADPTEDFVSLPDVEPVEHDLSGDDATTDFDADDRAAGVCTIIETAEGRDQTASGAFSITSGAYAIANSLGARGYQTITGANLRTVISGEDSSGFAEGISTDVSDIQPGEIGQTASDKCAQSAHPVEIEPGEYDVILEPAAVADMVNFLGYTTFNALAYQEGRSPVSGRLGEKICGENITIHDDGWDSRGRQQAFDFEGVPKQPITLVDSGVAANVVYDSYTAGRQGCESTGHALPAPNTWGPIPINQFVHTGDATIEEMIGDIDRGLYVTRFHYTNLVSPKQSIITGMTRDGTFLIEGGDIARGVKNLRFTQSILEAFSRVETIGSEGVLCGSVWAPAMLIRGFNFSGATEF